MQQNPADAPSQGINLWELEDCENMWFSGPDFLKQSEDLWPQGVGDKDHTAVAVEQRKVTHTLKVAAQNKVLEIELFSSLKKLRNVVAYVRRPFSQWKQQKF